MTKTSTKTPKVVLLSPNSEINEFIKDLELLCARRHIKANLKNILLNNNSNSKPMTTPVRNGNKKNMAVTFVWYHVCILAITVVALLSYYACNHLSVFPSFELKMTNVTVTTPMVTAAVSEINKETFSCIPPVSIATYNQNQNHHVEVVPMDTETNTKTTATTTTTAATTMRETKVLNKITIKYSSQNNANIDANANSITSPPPTTMNMNDHSNNGQSSMFVVTKTTTISTTTTSIADRNSNKDAVYNENNNDNTPQINSNKNHNKNKKNGDHQYAVVIRKHWQHKKIVSKVKNMFTSFQSTIKKVLNFVARKNRNKKNNIT